MGEYMTFNNYTIGDEGSNKLCLFNSFESYLLNSEVISVFEKGKVVAFIDYYFDNSSKTLVIIAFETLKKKSRSRQTYNIIFEELSRCPTNYCATTKTLYSFLGENAICSIV